MLHALLWVLGTLALILLVLVVLVLLLPLSLRVRADPNLTLSDDWDVTGPLPWKVRLAWGWVLVRADLEGDGAQVSRMIMTLMGITFRLPFGQGATGKQKPAQVGPDPKPKASKRLRFNTTLTLDLIPAGRRAVARLWRALGLRVRGDITYGFPDPALTGITLGYLHIGIKPRDLQISPEFMDPCLRGWVEGEARFILAKGLAPLLALAWTPAIRRRWMPTWKLRRTRRPARSAS